MLHDSAVRTTPAPFWPSGLIFAVLPLLISQVPAALAFAVNPTDADHTVLSSVPVPAWLFITVWTIIHPSMGVAAWHVWRLRDRTLAGGDPHVPLAMLIVGFLQTLTFWLTDSLRGIAAVDATGVLLAAVTWWVFNRFSPTAARWLLPWVIWMPVTLGIKIAAMAGAL